jgi:uncharacterized protein (DUF302 family)
MEGTSPGIVDVVSEHPAAESIDRLEALARARGLIVFARIDFSADAARVGLSLPPTIALLFGSPRAGTPVLAAEQRVGLELPLRVLAWEDQEGVVRLSYNSPEWIVGRHGIAAALAGKLAAVRELVDGAAGGGIAAGPPAMH